MIVYHGSNAKFNKFDQAKARIVNDFYGGGTAYFTTNIGIAKTYANSMVRSKGGLPYIYEVELNIRKTFDVDDEFTGKNLTKFFDVKEAELFARGAGLMSASSDRFLVLGKLKDGEYTLTGDQVFKGLSRGMVNTAKAREKLISLGYDSLRYNGGLNMGTATKHDVYLVYVADDITIRKVYKVVKKSDEKGLIKEELDVANIHIPPPGMTFSRELMPQIGPLGDFLKNLKKHNIKFRKELVNPKDIKASQAEFDKKIVAAIMKEPKHTKSGVIISRDNYILDGHHRWLAHHNQDRKVEVIRVDLPILELMRLSKTFDNTKYKKLSDLSNTLLRVIKEARNMENY